MWGTSGFGCNALNIKIFLRFAHIGKITYLLKASNPVIIQKGDCNLWISSYFWSPGRAFMGMTNDAVTII